MVDDEGEEGEHTNKPGKCCTNLGHRPGDVDFIHDVQVNLQEAIESEHEDNPTGGHSKHTDHDHPSVVVQPGARVKHLNELHTNENHDETEFVDTHVKKEDFLIRFERVWFEE